jgi:hypothetical protein
MMKTWIVCYRHAEPQVLSEPAPGIVWTCDSDSTHTMHEQADEEFVQAEIQQLVRAGSVIVTTREQRPCRD